MTNIKTMKELLSYLSDLSARSRENKLALVYLEDRKSTKYGFHSPWKPLPNTKDFMVSVNKLDPILTEYGVPRRLSPEMKNIPLASRLSACNRYLRIQLAVLRKLLVTGRTVDFWHRCMMLLAKSKVLRLVALRKLDKNWGRTLSINQVSTFLRFLDKKIQNLDFKVEYTRVYIDKTLPDGTKSYRPLANPSKPDRMLMYLISSFFTIFLRYYISPHQHAYQKVKGVNSAWKDLEDIKSYDYIYEFDLKGFFPSINMSYVFRELKNIGLPKGIAEWLLNMSMMYPKPSSLDPSKLDESNAIAKAELDNLGLLTTYHKPIFKYVNSTTGEYTGVVLRPILDWMEKHGKAALIDMMNSSDKTVDGLMAFDLGYPRVFRTHQEWYATLYEFYQIQSALNETFLQTRMSVDQDLRAGLSKNSTAFQKSLSEVRETFRVGEQEWKSHLGRDILDNEADFKVIPETHVLGFPQGSAMSPILSLVAFEYALWRDHFLKRFEALTHTPVARGLIKLVAYADDFIFLSKIPFTKDWIFKVAEGSKLWSMNIQFNPEKSRWAREAGVWKSDAIKFLGATYIPSLDLIKGTPRSGGELLFDKSDMVEAYLARDKILKELRTFCGWTETPQEILDKWGRNEMPFGLIPEEVISMESSALTPAAMASLKEATLRETLGEESGEFVISVSPEGNAQITKLRQKVKRIYAEFREHYKSTGMGGGWLRSPRLLGLIMSRLHSGSWTSVSDFIELDSHRFSVYNRPIDDPYSAHRFSWAKIAGNTTARLRHEVNLLNLSSYSTLSLLRSMDIKGIGLKHVKGKFPSSHRVTLQTWRGQPKFPNKAQPGPGAGTGRGASDKHGPQKRAPLGLGIKSLSSHFHI